MKILFFAPRFHTNLYFAMKGLLARGHRARFFAVFQGKSEEHGALIPEKLPIVPWCGLLEKIFNQKKNELFLAKWGVPRIGEILREIRASDADVVVIRNPNWLPFLAVWLACVVSGERVVIYTQRPKFRGTWRDRLKEWFLLDVMRCAWMTPVEGNRARAKRSHRFLCYIPFAVEAAATPKLFLQGGKIRLLAIGKFIPRKNHLMMIEAVARLKEEFPVMLTLVGEVSNEGHQAHLREVREAIRRRHLEGDVVIKINQPFRAMAAEYRAHDLYVFPSDGEPAGVSHLEAMAQGLPVICSDAMGTRCYVDEGMNGFIFKHGDTEDLIEKIRWAIVDRDSLKTMGANSWELAKTLYSAESFCDRLMVMLTTRWGLVE